MLLIARVAQSNKEKTLLCLQGFFRVKILEKKGCLEINANQTIKRLEKGSTVEFLKN